MIFEHFPNEILFELFRYLKSFDLIRCFSSLNSRFETLLVEHSNRFTMNFSSTRRKHFIWLCQTFLQNNAHRIRRLCLSNDDSTPTMVDDFLLSHLSIDKFIRIEVLTILDLCSQSSLVLFSAQLSNLSHLTRLTIAGSYLEFNDENSQRFVDQIWSLPKLNFCYLNLYFDGKPFPISSIRSNSIKSLQIYGQSVTLHDFIHLMDKTPTVEKLSIHIDQIFSFDHNRSFISLRQFSFTSNGQTGREILESLLPVMPNLSQLKVDLEDSFIDGHQWKSLIELYLPSLTDLRFSMQFSRHNHYTVSTILETFRTDFWINQRRLFVHCIRQYSEQSSNFHVLTIPQFSDKIIFEHPTTIDSTSTLHQNQRSLHYSHLSIRLSTFQSLPTLIDPVYVQHLTLSIENHLHSASTLVELLRSLISLRSLSFCQTDLHVLFSYLANIDQPPSIRLIRFIDKYYFDEQQSRQLTQLPIIQQCQNLYVSLRNHQTLSIIIENLMNHLHTLHIELNDAQQVQTLITSFHSISQRSIHVTLDALFHNLIHIQIE